MTILVTGAGGGLGRILFESLRSGERGQDVVGVNRSGIGGADVESCDVTDPQAVSELVRRVGPQLVFHLAGSFTNSYDIDYPVNALSARYLLEAIDRHAFGARVVLAGSAAEYGLVDPQENPVSESRALRPVSVYGLTKAFQTQIASYFAYAHRSNVVVARMFNLMAPGLSERLFVGRVERLIGRYIRGEVESISVGHLDHQRDYVGADEAIAQLRAIASRGEVGGVYNVGSGRPISMRSLLNDMLDAAGVPNEVVLEAVPEAGGRKGYDVPLIFADMSRTRALLHGGGR
jgi:GDP-4-dehydro-6-deoxy-D-mannose reductase